MEEQTTKERSKVAEGAVILGSWFWLLNSYYVFGIKLAGVGCETHRCHLLSLFLDSGTLIQKANTWLLNISPVYLDAVLQCIKISHTHRFMFMSLNKYFLKIQSFFIRRIWLLMIISDLSVMQIFVSLLISGDKLQANCVNVCLTGAIFTEKYLPIC